MALTLAQRREAYTPATLKMWGAAKIDAAIVKTVRATAQKMIDNQKRYQTVARGVGGNIPWWWIAITHYRESTMNFQRHLHNGDPLTKRTTHVPANRPLKGNPPFTFEESAIDALKLKQLDKVASWTVGEALLRFEAYNGFGYRSKGIPSPYVWAGTNQSTERGKYVADGHFDPKAVEKQIGTVAFMLALEDLGITLFPDKASQVASFAQLPDEGPMPSPRAEDPEDMEPSEEAGEANGEEQVPPEDVAGDPIEDPVVVLQVQSKLKELGYAEVGTVDGDRDGVAGFTDAAVLAFRKDNGLPLSPTIDNQVLVALMTAKPRNLGARAVASAEVVRTQVPEAKTSWWSKIVAGIGAFFTWLMTAITGIFDQSDNAQGYVATLKGFLTDVPTFVWIGLTAALMTSLWYLGRRGETQSKEAFRNGERR